MMDAKSFLSQPLLRLTAICSLPLVLFPLLHYLTVARYGSAIFLWFEVFLLLPVVVLWFAFVIGPILFLRRHHRALAARSLLAAVVLAAATVGGLRFGTSIRKAAFESLAERSAPLVQAVRSYEARHGAPPADLNALVPEFLPSIPGTGMAAYPQYEYRVGRDAASFDGNPWVLVVFTPSGGINFDQFLYFPLQNYPRIGYGGGLERIADWAYVHE